MTKSKGKTLTVALMDPPYESEASTTALRIIDAALRKGISVNVFAYEGAANLTMKAQVTHPNPMKDVSTEDQEHPTTARFISGLFEMSDEAAKLDWAVCGLCADERGAGDWIEGPRRGSPGDFYKFTQESANTLIIGAR